MNEFAYGTSHARVLSLGLQYAGVALLVVVLKFLLQFHGALLGEDLVRQIRGRIVRKYTRDRGRSDLPPGTVVSMLTAEAEGVGQFAGEAFATPLVEIGTLLSVVLYIGVSEPLLGLVLVATVAPQIIILGISQRRVNILIRERLTLLRAASDQTVDGVRTWPVEQILAGFDKVYDTRRQIYIFKLSAKSLLNMLTSLGTVGTLVLGAWLVLKGQTNIGVVVAAVGGLAQLARPWSALVTYYRTLSSVRVRYELLAETIH